MKSLIDNKDLIDISLDAHIRYMYSRIVDPDEREGFFEAVENLPLRHKANKQYQAGYNFYKNMVKEIEKKISDRFDGWSKDYVEGFERL
jgi:hypothetical protein